MARDVRFWRLCVSATAAALVLVSCGSDAEPTTTPAEQTEAASPSPSAALPPPMETTAPPTPAVAPGTVITVADSEFGPMLFDETGQAIYLFDKEKTPTPECYDVCAKAWPPVLTQGAPVAAAGARADLLGTSPRTDGSTQVTYAGHPLYFYANEGKNEVRCHNVFLNGGLWLVVTPDGQAGPV
jgi:predicted lipoprotein with Yx(FWY)xxD motif